MASRDGPLHERRGAPAAGALAALVVVLYAWPLADGTTSDSFSRADSLLRLVALTALVLCCLSASWRSEGRERAALLLVAGAAQAWALVPAARLAWDLLGWTGGLTVVDVAGAVVLGASASTALWLLGEPADSVQAVRRALEGVLVALSTFLVLHLVLPPAWSATGSPADLWRTAGASLLFGASLLALTRSGSARSAWPLLPQGLAVLAVGLVAASLPGTDLSSRASGALVTTGLTLAAVAVARGGAPTGPASAAHRSRGPAVRTTVLSVLPLAAVTAALPVLLGDAGVEPVVLLGVLVLGLAAVAHAHLLGAEGRAQARQLSEAELVLRHRAFHDELTGLPNRALFFDRLTHALDLHRRHKLPLSVLYGDLDGFKLVNDRYGHRAGDALLVAVAARLKACLRPEDTLARLGGDEFVLLLEHGSSADVVADRMKQALLEPFLIADRHVALAMSIGTARVGAHTPTPSPQEVLDRADADMYAGKLADRRPLAPAPPPPPPLPPPPPVAARPALPEPALAAALGRALHSGAVHVLYQPLVDAGTGTVSGMEALARWNHDGRVLLPAAFVDLADRFGLAGALTDVVLEQSCAQLATWSAAAEHRRLTMAVNVTPSQLGDPSLGKRVHGAAQRHGLHREQVVVETTVAALSRQAPVTGAPGEVLALSVAGFTGGPQHFALLGALPVRAVKVPRPRLAENGEPDDRLLDVLVALGREIDVRVVVERVERPEELAALRELSGVLAQGNLLSRPAEAATLDDIVLRGCPLPA
jgi:diguanylate cyclase (GGDEF)-like protein